jgi:hypothetical protein
MYTALTPSSWVRLPGLSNLANCVFVWEIAWIGFLNLYRDQPAPSWAYMVRAYSMKTIMIENI